MTSHSLIGVTDRDKHFMNMAYKEAELALESGDAAIGAVLVVGDTIIAKAHNTVKVTKDMRDHTEMLAINEALNVLKIIDFSQIKEKITLYTT